jgi:diacylglycerol kinase
MASPETAHSEATVPPRPRRSWRDKFKAAFRGVKLGVRGHSSFFVHFFFAALVVAVGLIVPDGLTLEQWCLVVGCIGLVLVAELFNSAVETLFRGLDDATKERTWPALDIAAGAVLLASLFAAVIGCIVFIPKLIKLAAPLFPA